MDTTSLPQHPCIRQIRHSRPGDNHEPILRSNGRQTSTISSSSGPWQQPSNTTSGFTNMTVWMSPSPPLPTPIHQALENEVTAHSQTLQKLQSEFLLRTTAQRELRDFHEFAAKRTSEYDQCWQELCRYRESYAQLMLEVENLRTQLETSNSIWEHLRVSEYRRPNSKFQLDLSDARQGEPRSTSVQLDNMAEKENEQAFSDEAPDDNALSISYD